MSHLPSFPAAPSSPSSPGGPGGPRSPLYPGRPGGPTHTHVHTYSMKYCDDYIFQELFKNQKTLDILYHWTNTFGRQRQVQL